ncbi:unnamed protein product [Ceutorhynchus assimilis]|uniref:DNA polymerase n=1 Tax=Ceutorhynchus assimilis TaxID=467358 RepID=A0A9N9QGF4_9CUCU|nr:unnamed protein product [Ceutorhynchus assimilis]
MESPTLVRIVVLDYYMSPPLPGLDVVYSEFRGASINQVPILRCFGSSEDGKKICVHIHGVFPYLYIPFDGKENPDQVMYQIATALDRAINISFNQASSNTQHVYKISLVSGIPMYGYHPKKHLFFKIYLYNPMLISKVGALLNNKNILDRVFQPHESHLNFTLQFMIDYNLHGMSNMLISEILYRINPECETADIKHCKFLPGNIEKTTLCELEADINAESILNRQEILSGKLAVNPGIAALWEDEKQRRRNKNEESQLGNFLSLEKMQVDPTKTHLIFQQALRERLAVLSIDKDNMPKLNPNVSVYPAETPTDSIIQNASIIDIHSSSSLELSLDDTLNITCSQLNETITPNGNNVTMDEVAQDFIRMLVAMADESVTDQGDESILSQKVPEEQNDDSTEDLLDLSMPLAALTTPIKVNSNWTLHENSDADDIDLNTTLIPQTDGQVDSLDPENECVEKLPMPLLDTSECGSNFAKHKSEYYDELEKVKLKLLVKIERLDIEELLRKAPKIRKIRAWERHSSEENFNETLKLMRYRMEKLNRKNKVKKIGSVLRKNYCSSSIGLFGKRKKPKFWNLPAQKGFLDELLDKSTSQTSSYIYLNCDGAMDSSTDEENPPKKKVLRKRVRSYTPLGLTVTSSPRIRKNYQGGPSENTIEISGKNKECQENLLPVTQAPVVTPIPYKRKLFTKNETILNHTMLEEFKACSYSPKPYMTGKTPKDATETVESNKSQSFKNSSSSDSDLFSENEGINRSFFRSYNLTISEKYDSENKYKAKQGCSTVFTPNSFPNSISSLKNEAISGNVSSDITPYQEETVNSQKRQQVGSIFKPSFKAPTIEHVRASLSKYKIPHVKQQEPFYSNVDDYTGTVEIGHRLMRVASRTTAHLLEFDSEFDGLNQHRNFFIENVANLKYNSNNINSLKLAHCTNKNVILCPLKKPPLSKEVMKWVKAQNLDEEIISSPETKTTKSKVYIPNSPGGGYDSDSDLSLTLTPYSASDNDSSSVTIADRRKIKCKKKPSIGSVLLSQEANKSCQISGMSHHNSYGFDVSVQNLQAARAIRQHQFLTTMIMELHIRTRGDLKPDPQFDNICAIFYSIYNDVPESDLKKSRTRGVIAVNVLPADGRASRQDFLNGISERDCDITYVDNEEVLINNFLMVIKYWDPDILAGYEIEMLSWGYLMERASVLSINVLTSLGRSQLHKYGKIKLKNNRPDMDTKIIGRIVLDVWRIMRHEIALQSYTFESIVYHILHRRVPMYQFKNLTFWWDHKTNLYRHRVIRYYLQRADTVLELFEKLDFLNRTSELARLFGILFYEVLSRGTQFRVESMMLRLAKPLNYVPVSPEIEQRARMKAPEYIALVMEPESKLYTDPVIVLDFQSLYPSIMIAYNYCFTTCLGRISSLGTNHPFEFGATQLKVSKKIVEKLCKRDLINYSPCGVAFVKQKLREGILPRMLKEVIDTRLMVKNSMKENKGDTNLQKVLHNRQLGLKLIANVTYGYTAANFSGRMCCVEVGDSVVSKGRETLQRAIAMVESTPEWEAKVVYGDTDSMFVLVPGKTRAEAFEIGKKIADAVTADNPDPIKLKLEKVYQPCILQTKKRYVGYMYDGPDQKEPVYEAKGIETVRRDGCPAVSKMLRKCLTLLFETKNVSLIKNYVLKQFIKIQTGRASIQDLTFAKEFRGASGYKPGACVPALELARKWTAVDRRNEPRNGERVPYIIVNGPPGLPLIRLVRSPRDLLNDNSLRPNALYYITKVIIPPINRCLNLIGADLNVWFNQMPRKNTQYLPNSSPTIKSTIAQYFATKICASCTEPTQDGICTKCCKRPNVTALILLEKLKKWEENYHNTLLICQSCTNCLDEISCSSLDCPVLYRRIQTFNDLQQSTHVRELLSTNSIFLEESHYGS